MQTCYSVCIPVSKCIPLVLICHCLNGCVRHAIHEFALKAICPLAKSLSVILLCMHMGPANELMNDLVNDIIA